jgi:acetyl esterase/lipase
MNVIKIKDFKIIFIGDSAGGTLCTSLTNWIIINNLPKPISLILNYPGFLIST